MNITRKLFKAASSLLIGGFIAFYASSCHKDESGTTAAVAVNVTETDAAQATTDAVTPSTNGLVNQLYSATDAYATAKFSCGVPRDSAITYASAQGATPSYNYKLNWNYLLTCNTLVADSLTFYFTGSGSYDGTRLSASDTGTGAFIMTRLGLTFPQYQVNAAYERKGTSTSKTGKQYSFTSDLKINSTNLLIDKTTQEIASGTATVTLDATSSSGKTASYLGTLTFLGSKKATLVMNSGTAYNLQW